MENTEITTDGVLCTRTCRACGQLLKQRNKESDRLFSKRETCGRSCTFELKRQTRTESRPFHSNFGGGWVSRSAYLAETMCNRQAKLKKGRLPDRFWKTTQWAQQHKAQSYFASQLLKKFSIESIIKALKTEKGKRVYSLGAPWLEPLVKEQQGKFETTKEKLQETKLPELPVKTEEVRPSFVPKESALSKLEGL